MPIIALSHHGRNRKRLSVVIETDLKCTPLMDPSSPFWPRSCFFMFCFVRSHHGVPFSSGMWMVYILSDGSGTYPKLAGKRIKRQDGENLEDPGFKPVSRRRHFQTHVSSTLSITICMYICTSAFISTASVTSLCCCSSLLW